MFEINSFGIYRRTGMISDLCKNSKCLFLIVLSSVVWNQLLFTRENVHMWSYLFVVEEDSCLYYLISVRLGIVVSNASCLHE